MGIHFALDRPLNQAVRELHPITSVGVGGVCPLEAAGRGICLGDPPGGSVRDASRESFPGERDRPVHA